MLTVHLVQFHQKVEGNWCIIFQIFRVFSFQMFLNYVLANDLFFSYIWYCIVNYYFVDTQWSLDSFAGVINLCGNTALLPFWLGHGNSMKICGNILSKIFAKSTQAKLQVKIQCENFICTLQILLQSYVWIPCWYVKFWYRLCNREIFIFTLCGLARATCSLVSKPELRG